MEGNGYYPENAEQVSYLLGAYGYYNYMNQAGANYANQAGASYANQAGANYANQTGASYANQAGANYANQTGANSAKQTEGQPDASKDQTPTDQTNQTGFGGDGWGNGNRRNASGQGAGGMYDNQSYMQRGMYYDASNYSGDMSGARMGGYGANNMGPPQKTNNPMYGYGDMDMSGGGGGGGGGGGSGSGTGGYGSFGYGAEDQSGGGQRGFDNYDGSGMQQNSFKPRRGGGRGGGVGGGRGGGGGGIGGGVGGDNFGSQKRMLSDYESNIALMQGGSYAGSSPYGKDNSKRNNDDNSNSGPQQGGNMNSFGPKQPLFKTPPASSELGPFPPSRPFGFSGYNNSGSRNTLFDDSRYRLGSGNQGFNPGPGGNPGFSPGRGRGRGRGFNRFGGRGGGPGGDSWHKGEKRGGDSGFQSGGPFPKRKKSVSQGQKNPVSFLNEIRPDIKFQIGDMEGPSNKPNFTVSLEFDGETYTASAKSKKTAKRYVSEAALRVYLRTSTAKKLGYDESMIEFSDGPEEGIKKGADFAVANKDEEVTEAPKLEIEGGKNPVMHLNEIRKDAVYDLKEESGQAHSKKFIMRVTVSGQTFEGTGQNKKLAKAAAARVALKELGLLEAEQGSNPSENQPDAENGSRDKLEPRQRSNSSENQPEAESDDLESGQRSNPSENEPEAENEIDLNEEQE